MRLSTFTISLIVGAAVAGACTSAMIDTRRPIIWKHRDTSAEINFLHRVDTPGRIPFVGLFNGTDTTKLDEAWMGVNDRGFAIINTVAYNLPENKPDCIDREGYVMAEALGKCETVDDFAAMLDSLPRPMGVRTNFGVLDANGNGAYFETSDSTYTRFNLADTDGIMIRTNYAYSGTEGEGMGYIRHRNVEYHLGLRTTAPTPRFFTDTVSCSYYNSLQRFDALRSNAEWIVDQDFVPRRSSTASIAIELPGKGESLDSIKIYARLGYPPLCETFVFSPKNIPAEMRDPNSPHALQTAELLKQVFPIKQGSGPRYLHLPTLKNLRR